MSQIDQSIKLFNTAIITTKLPKDSKCGTRLNTLVRKDAFQAILKVVREYSTENGISEDAAAEEIIRTFREFDRVWDDYIYQEGLDRLKNQLDPKETTN